MAEPGESEFQRALGYAVQRVQKTTFSPKPEQTVYDHSVPFICHAELE